MHGKASLSRTLAFEIGWRFGAAATGSVAARQPRLRAQKFASFVYGLADRLNSGTAVGDLDDAEHRLSIKAMGVQCLIEGISLYPFIAVLERTTGRVSEFVAPKHGTEWQPFLS